MQELATLPLVDVGQFTTSKVADPLVPGKIIESTINLQENQHVDSSVAWPIFGLQSPCFASFPTFTTIICSKCSPSLAKSTAIGGPHRASRRFCGLNPGEECCHPRLGAATIQPPVTMLFCK